MKAIIKRYTKSIVIVAGMLMVCNLLSTLHPNVMKQVLDMDFTSNQIEQKILQAILVYVSIHILLVLLKNWRNIYINKVICNMLKDIRKKVFDKVLNFKMITFNKYNSSELYTRLTDDIDNLFDLFFGLLYMVVNNVLYIVFMMVMMFIANIHLAIISTIAIGIIAMVVLKSAQILGNLDNEVLKKRDKENKQFSELYNKNKLTYLFKLQHKNIEHTNELFDAELKLRRRYIFVHHFPYWILTLIQAIAIYVILYYALNIQTAISLGSIYLVLFYTKECKTPLEEIFNQLEELQTCFNSYKRVKALLEETKEEDIETGEYVEDLNGDIEFQNVSMRYQKELILQNISFHIKKGTKVTIAGRTGVGKTTLTNVLMKLYDIESGKILMNHHDIAKVSTKCLRSNISYISQTPYIFSDTVRNNITLGDSSITDEKINDLIQEIGVEEVFNKLKEGLDTKIKLSKLSYGELQIIAFIRAILHKANIYIFDEPTSNMDLKTENMIQNIINQIAKTSTVIIIAHRKSTLENSDKIIYLKEGKIDMIVNK